jgi:hypothetical protein
MHTPFCPDLIGTMPTPPLPQPAEVRYVAFSDGTLRLTLKPGQALMVSINPDALATAQVSFFARGRGIPSLDPDECYRFSVGPGLTRILAPIPIDNIAIGTDGSFAAWIEDLTVYTKDQACQTR